MFQIRFLQLRSTCGSDLLKIFFQLLDFVKNFIGFLISFVISVYKLVVFGLELGEGLLQIPQKVLLILNLQGLLVVDHLLL